jgi:hypothetical protein
LDVFHFNQSSSNTHRVEADFCELTLAGVRMSVIDEIGFLDNNFGFYHEDADFGFRCARPATPAPISRACVTLDGPPEAEASGVLKMSLTPIASNWDRLRKHTEAECASVVKGNAYGCGIEPIVRMLSQSGCKTFFVTNLPEAKRVRAIAPNATMYVPWTAPESGACGWL